MTAVKSKAAPSNKIVILDVAEHLFVEHGYRETTVSDIAQHAGMSASNLYRHYKNKEDIAAACASRFTDTKIAALREVLQLKRMNAAERLEEFIVALLRYTHEETQNSPRMNELIGVVIQSRQEVLHTLRSNLQSMIAEILSQGNAKNEFAVENVLEMSEIIFIAITFFGNPMYMHLYPLSEFERCARATAKLLVRGLARR